MEVWGQESKDLREKASVGKEGGDDISVKLSAVIMSIQEKALNWLKSQIY